MDFNKEIALVEFLASNNTLNRIVFLDMHLVIYN